MGKTRTRGIRVGDTVRVVTPKLFVRCGYQLSLDDVAEKVEAELGERVRQFLASIGLNENSIARIDHKIIREIAYIRAKSEGFGGRERTIHTVDVPEMAGRVLAVDGVRFVKTGEYCRGFSYGEDYEPPYLSNEKTHRILSFNDYFLAGRREIEAANVELVKEVG